MNKTKLDITEADKQLWREYISNYSPVSPKSVSDAGLDEWRECKAKYLYTLMGESFTREINAKLDYPVINDYTTIPQISNLRDCILNFYQDPCLEDPTALMCRAFCNIIFKNESLLSQCAFQEKRTTRGICFHKGEKWVKSARKFITKVCKELPEDLREKCLHLISEAQTAYSMMVQNFKDSSLNLTLSIHPLDYVTMSDNEANWQSCMSWKFEGDYHAGTIEMMNSSCVVVAYIAQKNTTMWNGWNSKRWRQLFVVHPSCIIASCPYPYPAEHYTNIVFKELKKLAAEKLGWHYEDKLSEINEDTLTYLYDHTFNDDCYMYVDYLEKSSTCAIAFRAKEEYDNLDSSELDIEYSGRAICPVCGKHYIPEADAHICDDCQGEDYGTCDICEKRHHLITMPDGSRICNNCFENETFYCEECGESYYLDSNCAHDILVKGEGEMESWNEVVCDSCYETLQQEDRIIKDYDVDD